eukprot:6492795-Amphidinium_carterae.7
MKRKGSFDDDARQVLSAQQLARLRRPPTFESDVAHSSDPGKLRRDCSAEWEKDVRSSETWQGGPIGSRGRPGATSRGGRRVSAMQAALGRGGPANLEELLRWPQQIQRRASELGLLHASCWESSLDITLSSHYSGVGTAEVVLDHLQDRIPIMTESAR